jgi:hypothetical protein
MAYCVNCGGQLPAGATFCTACGAAAGQLQTEPRRSLIRLRVGIALALVAGLVVVGIVTRGGSAGSNPLPLASNFQGVCPWPRGSLARGEQSFSFGCRDGRYQLRLNTAGPYHVFTGFRGQAPAVRYDIDVTYAPDEPVQHVSEPSWVVGVQCLAGQHAGYGAEVGDDGAGAIDRIRGDRLLMAAGGENTGTVGRLRGATHLTIVCAQRGDGTDVVGMFVDGRLLHAVFDPEGYGPFRGVGVYAAAYPGVVGFDNFRATRPTRGVLEAIRDLARSTS